VLTGATTRVHPAAEAKYAPEPSSEAQRFRFGAPELEIIETPGHPPDSVWPAATNHARAGDAKALFTGNRLFIGDIGRPDLASGAPLEQQARNLYDRLCRKLARFPDRTTVYPAHGEGSLCGEGMSAKPMTTLGHQPRNNPLSNDVPFKEFRRVMTEGFRARLDSLAAMAQKNRQRPTLLSEAASCARLSTVQVERTIQDGAKLVDDRDEVTFGAAFLPGSINVGIKPNSGNSLGMVVDAGAEIILAAGSEADALEAVFRFGHAGYDRLIRRLADGVSGRTMQGKALDHPVQLKTGSRVHVPQKYPEHIVLDVQADAERPTGHIDRAIHKPISEQISNGIDLDKKRQITTVCGSRYRGNVAGSALRHGDRSQHLLLGGGHRRIGLVRACFITPSAARSC